VAEGELDDVRRREVVGEDDAEEAMMLRLERRWRMKGKLQAGFGLAVCSSDGGCEAGNGGFELSAVAVAFDSVV